MTPTDRFSLIMLGLTVAISLTGWGVRMMWQVSASIQRNQDATEANTKALGELTPAVGDLAKRLATVEGQLQRRRGRWR